MTNLKYNATLTKTDPHNNPVLIIGQIRHLNSLKFDEVKDKLLPRVTEEVINIIFLFYQ